MNMFPSKLHFFNQLINFIYFLWYRLGCPINDTCFEKELIVIGMVPLVDGHAAEEIKNAIEKIVNSYSFDKYKIRGINKNQSLFLPSIF